MNTNQNTNQVNAFTNPQGPQVPFQGNSSLAASQMQMGYPGFGFPGFPVPNPYFFGYPMASFGPQGPQMMSMAGYYPQSVQGYPQMISGGLGQTSTIFQNP